MITSLKQIKIKDADGNLQQYDLGINSINIPANANLNDYVNPGMYYCELNDTAKTIANVPNPLAFSLLVEKHAGAKQTFTTYGYGGDLSITYTRNFYDNTWSSWDIIQRSKILYDNWSGTSGTVTCTEPLTNFSEIEIYYSDDWAICDSVKKSRVNDGFISVPFIRAHGSEFKQFYTVYSISGDSILNNSADFKRELTITSNTYPTIFTGNDTIKIYKVIGYL